MTDFEAPEAMKFEVLRAAVGDGAAARLGNLVFPKRTAVKTPNFFAITSRGTVPHVTPDNISKHGKFGGSYIALEDFTDQPIKNMKKKAPIFLTPPSGEKPLHAYTALPSSHVTILGPRRHLAVPSPRGNGADHVSICASTGFQKLAVADYVSAVETLQPDIAIPTADINYGSTATQQPNRQARQAERSEDWLTEWCSSFDAHKDPDLKATSVFAPTLAVPYPMQWEYLNRLSEDLLPSLSGLAVYDADILSDLRDYPSLLPLPRLSVDAPPTPHHILRQIFLGVDVLLIPFLNTITDAGVALTFTFPAPKDSTSPLPLGIDLSDPAHKTSLLPFSPSCTCYACTNHHRAFVHHLLDTREMLAWTLLQLHNHAVIAEFFAGVRAALAAGPGVFDAECRRFALAYEPELPAGVGTRPRARGYHFKSETGNPKINPPAWENLEQTPGVAPWAETMVGSRDPVPGVGQARVPTDMSETPVVPEMDSTELEKEGFAGKAENTS